MAPEFESTPRQRIGSALIPLFLTSGATSLVYETLWERQLHLVFGTSQVAVYTVLAAFMCGLAMGGFAAARLAPRVARPLRAYALLEGFIGLYALVFPAVMALLEPLYIGFWNASHPTPFAFAVFQFALLGLTLLPPTACMGATLPLLVRLVSEGSDSRGSQVGRLYGANTLGAVIGTGLAGFVLLPTLGLALTTYITAAGNAALCVAALLLDRPLPALAPADRSTGNTGRLGSLAAVALIAGFASLVCEVSWFRLMVLILGGSAYAFSIMLLSFLVGIGAGGWAGGGLADLAWRRGGERAVLKGLAALQAGVALLTWGAMFLYGELPFLFVYLYAAMERLDPYLRLLWPGKLLLAMAVMVPPALLMGATFPFLVRACKAQSLESDVGRLYGWNTVGAIAGAAGGGLLLLPKLHVVGALLVAVSLNLGAALLMLRRANPRAHPGLQAGWAVAGVWAAVLLHLRPPPWDPLLMTAGMYKYASELDDDERNRQGILEFAVDPYELLYYEEGLSSVVTVAMNKDSSNIWLANNGKVDASTSVDMPTQVLVAHLPYAFKPRPENVLVIGLASGVTAGSAALHSAPRRIDVVELEPAVVEASRYFDNHNSRPLEDPRVQLHINDGRNHVTLTPDGTYDLVISEPSNPWLTGVSNLFTREFLELGKRKLRPGGVWGQWVQMYGMGTEDLRSLVATFLAVYEHVLLFSTIEDADLVLVGSDEPLEASAARFAEMIGMDAAVAMDLRQIGCPEPEDLLVRLQLERPGMERFAGSTPLNTDDNMKIEYSAPLNLHRDTSMGNFNALLKPDGGKTKPFIPFYAVEGADGLRRLAEAYARGDDWIPALITLEKALELRPGDAELGRLYEEYHRKLRVSLGEEEGLGERLELPEEAPGAP